jgi:type IV secretory pathway VirB6-like protein
MMMVGKKVGWMIEMVIGMMVGKKIGFMIGGYMMLAYLILNHLVIIITIIPPLFLHIPFFFILNLGF